VLIFSTTRKADKDLYNKSAEDFIPIACHYDADTLLTKNGELIQIIQINGINSEHISTKLFNLREIVRNAIKKHVKNDNFAFWLHTVRRKSNLDDLTPYSKTLPANIHDLWKKKNYWDDKFVNTLYISVIYDSTEVKINNIKTLMYSLLPSAMSDSQDKYLNNAFAKLNETVNMILTDLNEYGATKLGIRFVGDNSFSDLMFLYRRIIHLTEDDCFVPITDLSTALASNQYAFGGDKIEVISSDDTKKFAAILSIKEYKEVSSEMLDKFLQLPVELIVTEIFYFIEKDKVTPIFQEQDYILKVSGDSKLNEIKGITKMMDSKDPEIRFCQQQISLTIIGIDIKKLENDIKNVSKELSRIGIVHVREDINLEQTFWAQLPGNFSFIRRMSPTILENTAALASLHNFPTGNQYNPWGKAITLLRTEKGTPYFVNFHASSKNGNTCIFGTARTGKTVLMNFLISESSKYNPTILYLSDNNDSKIFIAAIEGIWVEETKNIINPFLLEDNSDSRLFINEFLKIICNHHEIPLTNPELAFLEILTSKIFTLDQDNRNLAATLKITDFTGPGGELIKIKLAEFNEGGFYHGIFDNKTNSSLFKAGVVGINLHYFTDKYFTSNFYPDEKKLVEKFKKNLKNHSNVRSALIYALSHYISTADQNPKILVMDNIDRLLSPNSFPELIVSIIGNLSNNNGITLSNFNLSTLETAESSILSKWMNLFDTKIILPSDVKIENLDKMFELNKRELEKWLSFTVSSRMFLIKQDNQYIAAELSIGSFEAILSILSADNDEINIYEKILKEYPGHTDNWINQLYKELEPS